MRCALVALLAAMLVMALGIVALSRLDAVASNRIYTVAEVRAGLRQHPQAWAGHTIQLTGAAMMNVRGTCPSSAPACTPPTWVYLGSEGTAGWNKPRRMLMLFAFIDQQAAASLENRRPIPLSRIPGTARMLLLKVPGGTSVAAQMRRPLPDALYDLPLVGKPLSRLFPGRTRPIITVRLTPLGVCARPGTAVCPDGIVLP